MKHAILIFLVVCLATIKMNAQQRIPLEVSANPIILLFGVGVLAVDANLDANWSVGTDIFLGANLASIYLNGKHYFRPRKGTDGFNVGTFLTIPSRNDGASVGFFGGHKWVSQKNITFEVALGVGRQFGEENVINALPYFKLNVGYRFR
ncbi:MAG: hypothetical protein AAGI49_14290 [Bacteroidota bacterium]